MLDISTEKYVKTNTLKVTIIVMPWKCTLPCDIRNKNKQVCMKDINNTKESRCRNN